MRPDTRLIVVSDLHNPTGARLHADDVALLLREAERVDAAVLIDEVYLEMDLLRRPTAARAHPRIIVTSSLTKAHGLGGLRIGWILADPGKIERITNWNDLICPAHPVPSIAVATAYLPRAAEFLTRTRAMVEERLAQADRWVRARRDVSWVTPAGGITGFLRLENSLDSEAFAEHAWARHGVRVIPGAYFGAKGHVRISYGLPARDLEAALDGARRRARLGANHAGGCLTLFGEIRSGQRARRTKIPAARTTSSIPQNVRRLVHRPAVKP